MLSRRQGRRVPHVGRVGLFLVAMLLHLAPVARADSSTCTSFVSNSATQVSSALTGYQWTSATVVQQPYRDAWAQIPWGPAGQPKFVWDSPDPGDAATVSFRQSIDACGAGGDLHFDLPVAISRRCASARAAASGR